MTNYFDFQGFWNRLTQEQRNLFAFQVGLSEGYISSHLRYARRQPSLNTMMRLHQACIDMGEELTTEQLLRFFAR